MTQQELLQSLNTEQGAALNVILEQNFNLNGSEAARKAAVEKLASIVVEHDAAKSELASLKSALAFANSVVEQGKGVQAELDSTKAQLASAQAQLDAARAIYAKAKDALQAGDVIALKALHAEVEKPAVQREIDALTAQLDALQKKQAGLGDAQDPGK